ncbi:unnamed protein product [Linum tenue]|uniref:Thioredoxin domain-containing protein n=1 Tax=Linum tenue TaxID=586396 RepID=A0AAV0RXX7_9ROSI|nr:unnamed protein product [Linum tenue]
MKLLSTRKPYSRRDPSSPVSAKKESFANLDELLQKSDKPVLVDFYATWCGPCQFMVPILEEVSIIMNDTVQVVKIDTEKYTAIANQYDIQALPTFILFKDGKPIDRFVSVPFPHLFHNSMNNGSQCAKLC